MKQTINVLVIEDNEYYNNMLSNAIQQSISSILLKGKYRLSLRSVTDAGAYMKRIRSDELECINCIAFIDYDLGNGLNAEPVISMIKERDPNAVIVLLSQSKPVREESRNPEYEYFVVKDNLAPAFCCLYLRQFIENKFSVTFDK